MTSNNKKTPYIIATGFTTAFLGDERTLREFIIGDYMRDKMVGKGENAVLYLINDSYDPLNYRQLRVGVNKDEKLLRQFENYCGRPISEIPDPFECHESYSQHFTRSLLERLHSLDIHPVVLDSYHAYRGGYYSNFISSTFENYHKIQEMLAGSFDHYTMKNLFRVQCPKCLCIDVTHIREVAGSEIQFECERCGTVSRQDIIEIRGKLSWKLDCAARWNLYGIDMETFSKAHVAELGSFEISRFMSRHFYGGKVPAIVKYGDVRISRELSYRLLEILPPVLLRKLFTSHLTRDLDLTRDSIENFCSKFPVRPGLSYVDYVRRELPKEALYEENQQGTEESPLIRPDKTRVTSIDDKSLVTYGNRFSRFYYNKEYGIRFPDAGTIASAHQTTVETALRVIQHSLSVRNDHTPECKNISAQIKSYLAAQKASPQVYQFLRRVFGQSEGPNITTLLAILPKDYLSAIGMILSFSTEGAHTIGNPCPEAPESLDDSTEGGFAEALEVAQNIRSIAELIETLPLLEVNHEKDKSLSPATTPSCPVSGLPEGG